MVTDADTLPKLLLQHYQRWGDKKIAMRVKDLGIWQNYTWKDSYENVKWISLGLISLGFERGDKVCIIGDNDPQWYWAEYAAQAAGGIAAGIFVDCVPEEVKYQVQHSDAKFVFARDQEQVDKVLEIKEVVPLVKKVIYWDPKGMWSYDDPFIMSFEQLGNLGKEYEKTHPGLFEASVEEGKVDDLAVFCYTSGTSGLPKGAVISHRTLVHRTRAMFEVDPWYDTDEYLSLFAPAWITEQCFGIAGSMVSGAVVNFPEEPETIPEDTREVGPEFVLYTSRMWEGLSRVIQAKIDDADFFKKNLFTLFLPVGYRVSDARMEKGVTPFWAILWAIADLLVFHALRDKLGLSRLRACYTGGSVTSPDAFRFLQALGLDIRQIYGSSEAALVTLHRKGEIRLDTIGPVVAGYELRVGDEGELLVKGEALFRGYYKNPEATAKAVTNGWFHTGDAGYIDEEGHVIYIDRVSDLMELYGGQKYSPQHIEGRLKFSRYIRDAIVVTGKSEGEEIAYVIAIIQIDFDIVGRWAERNRINYTTFTDLSQKMQVYDLVEKDVLRVNKALPEAARAKKFILLHKELDADEAEVTRTRKLRRDFIETKYENMLRAAYEGKDGYLAEAEVRYQDGRVSKVTTPVRIRTLGKEAK